MLVECIFLWCVGITAISNLVLIVILDQVIVELKKLTKNTNDLQK